MRWIKLGFFRKNRVYGLRSPSPRRASSSRAPLLRPGLACMAGTPPMAKGSKPRPKMPSKTSLGRSEGVSFDLASPSEGAGGRNSDGAAAVCGQPGLFGSNDTKRLVAGWVRFLSIFQGKSGIWPKPWERTPQKPDFCGCLPKPLTLKITLKVTH